MRRFPLGRGSVLVMGLFCAHGACWGADEVPFSVGLWSRGLGNHRVNVVVMQPGEAVRAHIPWRRRDSNPEAKGIIVIDVTTDQRIRNVVCVNVNREFGDLVFEPTSGFGGYAVYYMPYTHSGPNHRFVATYAPVEDTAEPDWLERNKLRTEDLPGGQWQSLPEANVIGIQARSEFDRMDPMEVIATAEETRQLLAKHADLPYLLFPEDRRFPIRMTDDLPLRWMRNGPSAQFRGKAARGEFYVFQIGVYAAKQAIEDIRVEFGGLDGLVGPEAFRCINTGGTDWLGRKFDKRCAVAQGKVGALWCGVQIPKEANPGSYEGKLTIRPKEAPPTEVKLALEVASDVLEDAGDSELWRQSRLRWLDSTIGLDDEVVAPYTPLEVNGDRVSCLGRAVRFEEGGLLSSIRCGEREMLAGPMTFYVETDSGRLAQRKGPGSMVKHAPGVVVWNSQGAYTGSAQENKDAVPQGEPMLGYTCGTRMEFDGYLNFRITLRAERAAHVKDMGLEVPLRRDVATYLMGMGRKGGYRPAEWQWAWDPNRANNSVWVGDVDAGLQCKLKGANDRWNLYALGQDGLPQSWANGGKGGCRIFENDPDRVMIQAYSGERDLKAGEELTFCFGQLITPVKPLDQRHWNWRYQHQYVKLEDLGTSGANILNIHHGNELNPHINYPFNNVKLLGSYVRQAHKKGMKLKIYYTVRELSNHAAEIWALRSLGTEVFLDGPGGGCSWLREHLVKDYASAWHEPNLPNDDIDGAIATAGLSRWHNYYLEGLAWLLKNVEIDGLYLDGIGYDRVIMQRVRKVMERTRPGALIDFHSGNNFAPEYGLSSPANQYLEHFPYIDSLWFGEGYDYNETPDYWLVEISGIPFGLFGEMLQGGGNPWRGMVYGMTNRLGWQGDPRPIWKLWDAFGIHEARMIGYWDESCPVRTDNNEVLTTVYSKKNKALVALASWAAGPVQCKLHIDWEALGLDAKRANVHAPAVEGFQDARQFMGSDAIPVEPARGWWLVIE